jgi:hypothetical protein
MFTSQIANGFAAAGIDVPKIVTDAQEYARVVATLQRQILDETAPDLNTATAKTAAQMIDQYGAFKTSHTARVEAAQTLVRMADSQLAQAWETAASSHRAEFADRFNAIAAEVGAMLDDAPYIDADNVATYRRDPSNARLFEALGNLTALDGLRSEFANHDGGRTDGTHSEHFERQTRTLHLLDARGYTRTGAHLGPNQQHGDAYWVAAHRSPHVVIRWQELDEQREQVNTLSNSPDSIARTAGARSGSSGWVG